MIIEGQDQRKKILFVITKGNWGGAQRYVYDLATALPKGTYDISVAFGTPGRLKDELDSAKIRTLPIPNLGRDINSLKDARTFFNLLAMYKSERPDIVHLNSSKIGGLGALAARFAGIRKIVFTVHGFAFNESRPAWQRFIIVLLSWITILLSTDTIFISRHDLDQAKAWPFISKKLALIYNGIAVPPFLSGSDARTEIAGAIGKPAGLLEGKKMIGSIAELTANKGLSYGIDAMKNIADALYIIIGSGEEKEALERKIAENGLQERVFFAGFVKDASRLLKAFDVFLLPSRKEGLPYVILEAGYAEVPVVSTFVGGIPEVLEDSITGYKILAADPASISEKVNAVLADPLAARSVSSALKAAVSSAFSLDSMIKSTEKVYGADKVDNVPLSQQSDV
jgi:glycosyltransferase involved in cell wall biosynthesis